MILLCGIPTEAPLEMVTNALGRLRVHFFVFNQRRVAQTRIDFTVRAGKAMGWLECGSELYRIEDFEAVYLRLMDDRFLPELKNEPEASAMRTHSRTLHDTLTSWLEVTDACVVNRPSAMASNNSKPYQAQLIRKHGLRVPDTLITNEPELVHDFRRRHGRIIYKSISGVRSIVQLLEENDLGRLEKIRWCPTQFQEFIEGDDVRVHVVGERVFATRVRSKAIDYRYAQTQVGASADLEPFDPPMETVERCVALAKALELSFAGIDLKFTPDGDVYCFEVNPCPGFSYYEANTGQPIAEAVADFLSTRTGGHQPASLAAVASPGG